MFCTSCCWHNDTVEAVNVNNGEARVIILLLTVLDESYVNVEPNKLKDVANISTESVSDMSKLRIKRLLMFFVDIFELFSINFYYYY